MSRHSASASVKSPSLRLSSQPQNPYLSWTDLKRRLTSVGLAGSRHVKHLPHSVERLAVWSCQHPPFISAYFRG